ncbi:MAG TPA: dihydrofolate reductase [Steroidobacteraceae bacterium]|nr:dihydrofolate reductase [Steroidobacteraceae bacterium]
MVAVSENDAIGRANRLPWHLPADLRHFKALTVGKPVLMGRKTLESIGKPLPERPNIVLSRSSAFAAPGCRVVPTVEAACRAAMGAPALMVIGGAEVFRLCLPLAVRIHLTRVQVRIEDGDAWFPAWRGGEWVETAREQHDADDKNAYAYTFATLDRRQP